MVLSSYWADDYILKKKPVDEAIRSIQSEYRAQQLRGAIK